MNDEIIQINEKTWSIEDIGVRFFLLTGDEKALLIDSGLTIHDAKEIAESLTDLPVELLNTNADIDHIGSNHEFEAVYMNPVELYNYCEKIKPIWDGDVIDLGNRHIRVITLPGHTPGNVALLDVENRVLFSADSIQDRRIFMFDAHRNIRTYLLSLKKIARYTDEFDEIYPSHGTLPLKPDIIPKLIDGTERVMRGEATYKIAGVAGRPVKAYDLGVARLLCDVN